LVLHELTSGFGNAATLIYHTGMHSSCELSSDAFEISVDGRRAALADLFEGFSEGDRLGVIVRRPCGAVGASALICATITAFYDLQRARGDDFFVYPEYYLFHAGGPHGDHARLDIFPRRKEPVVDDDPEALLEAVNERAITRLVVEDGSPRRPQLDRAELESARARLVTCLAYSPSGRVADADVRIAGNDVTEGYVQAVLDPESRMARLRAGSGEERALADAVARRAGEVPRELRAPVAAARASLLEDGRPVETYRRLGLDEALALL
jgi:hypothetical protein